MSAASNAVSAWLADPFWDRLQQLESRHQRIQSEHEALRRDLDEATLGRAPDLDLRETWQRYCEVIAELERTTAEFGTLRPRDL